MEMSEDHVIFWSGQWKVGEVASEIDEGRREMQFRACPGGKFLQRQVSMYQIKQVDKGTSGDLVVSKF
jgi:hypothetical protein